MLEAILSALKARTDLTGWGVQHITTREAQLYAVLAGVESRRSVTSERYVVEVFRTTAGPEDKPSMGSGNATLLPGAEIDPALDEAVLMAGLMHNPPHTLPGPADYPIVPLADPGLQADPAGTLDGLLTRLQAAAASHPWVRMTAAELFAEEENLHLVTSRGIDAEQVSTRLDMEWVLVSQKDGREVETYIQLTRRRPVDVDLEAEMARRAGYASDLLESGAPVAYNGPVVLRADALQIFLNSDTLHTLSSGEAHYARLTTCEIGQAVLRKPTAGDPLTVYANRRLPFGTSTNRFDSEGLPAQRIELIKDGVLQAFIAGQRYADYLGIPATGTFGNFELLPGRTPAVELLVAPHVEVADFSWFNPDSITGDFACEIRLGYVVDGDRRSPFKGGMLVGNVLDALANVRYSQETTFLGDYLGPSIARFDTLTVTGAE